MDTETEQALIDLQSRVAFQDDAIHALNRTVARQQQLIDGLQKDLEQLQHHVRALTPDDLPDSGEDPLPPHY